MPIGSVGAAAIVSSPGPRLMTRRVMKSTAQVTLLPLPVQPRPGARLSPAVRSMPSLPAVSL
jgi:hypothetical protein